ncbi:MAG: ATP synthase subunit I [Desulfohalobiaceae bacterium]|nr:ATP synthase subunit I [Desulfohalobiaceae bacterium]
MRKTVNADLRSFLGIPGGDYPEIQRILALHSGTVAALAALLFAAGWSHLLLAYALGALLASFNLLVLARLVPQLVFLRSGAVFSLLVSFYLRLFFTGGVLFAAVYAVQLNALGLLLGLSTVFASFLAWGGSFLVSRKQKEA